MIQIINDIVGYFSLPTTLCPIYKLFEMQWINRKKKESTRSCRLLLSVIYHDNFFVFKKFNDHMHQFFIRLLLRIIFNNCTPK